MRFLVGVLLAAYCLLHGAIGQNAGGLNAIVESGVEGPIVVIDLVKFKPEGEARYNEYDAIAKDKVEDLGGEYVFRGTAKEVPGIDNPWDRLTMRKYPNAQAVLDMASSPEYRGAFPHRMAGVAKSFVYAFSTVAGDVEAVPPPDSDDAVYMLNLLRFNPDGGEATYFQKYGAAVQPMIAAQKGAVETVLSGVGPVMADEKVDRLILVRYPTVEAFRKMIESDEYQAIAHFRTESIELGLLFPFTHAGGK